MVGPHPTRSSPLHRDQTPGIDLKFLRGFLDCLVRIDCLDAADDLGLVGRAINVPGYQPGPFRFLRHAASIGRELCTFNRRSRDPGILMQVNARLGGVS